MVCLSTLILAVLRIYEIIVWHTCVSALTNTTTRANPTNPNYAIDFTRIASNFSIIIIIFDMYFLDATAEYKGYSAITQ